jgi:hypothetical protein
MARTPKIPTKAPPPAPDEHLPRARLVWGHLATTRRDADLWPLSRLVKAAAARDEHSTPMAFGVRALRALDGATQCVVIGVGGEHAPHRYDAPRSDAGIVAREHPVSPASFARGYFSDACPADDTIRRALDEVLAAPAWRAAAGRLMPATDPAFPRIVDVASVPTSARRADDPLSDACWFLALENSDGEAALVHGRMVPCAGDLYEGPRVRTFVRATDEAEVVRVIGVPIARVSGREPLVAVRYDADAEVGRAWARAAEAELRAVLPGDYAVRPWLLAPTSSPR